MKLHKFEFEIEYNYTIKESTKKGNIETVTAFDFGDVEMALYSKYFGGYGLEKIDITKITKL